jgi:5-methylcytosine-specific restriction endonuclease McrA
MSNPLSWRADRYLSSTQRGYGYRWQRARAGHLISEPLCRMCKAEGKLRPATIVDHIIPHRGDKRLFWDRKNWQSLCTTHHDSTKQAEEKTGRLVGVGHDGRPTHPQHPWNRR